jgi:hypothetical protein
VSERLTRRLVDRQGGPSGAAFTGSVVLVAAAFVVGFLLALGSTGAEPQRPAGDATALRVATSPQTASRSVRLRAVLALPELRRHHRPSATTTASRAPSAPEALSVAREPSAPEPVNSAPEPTIAPAVPAPAAPAIPAPSPEAVAPEPRERSQPQRSFDSSGEFDSSG